MTRDSSRREGNGLTPRLSIVLVGIGGQGILLATRLLGELARRAGLPTVGAENHGMSQRGGSVLSHLKLGGFRSPLVREGTADVLVGLERTEALRALRFLRPEGLCLVNSEPDPWPAEIGESLRRARITTVAVPADRVARDLGAPRVANTVLLAATVAHARGPFESAELRQVVEDISPARFLEANLRAMEAGASAVASQQPPGVLGSAAPEPGRGR